MDGVETEEIQQKRMNLIEALNAGKQSLHEAEITKSKLLKEFLNMGEELITTKVILDLPQERCLRCHGSFAENLLLTQHEINCHGL